MYKRPIYLEILKEYQKDDKLIKIIKGVRRSGKSELMKLFIEELFTMNIKPNQILYIDFESMAYEELKDYKALYQHIMDYSKKINIELPPT